MVLESSRRGGEREVRVEERVAKRASSLVIAPSKEAIEAIGVETGSDDGGATGGDERETDWAGFAFD